MNCTECGAPVAPKPEGQPGRQTTVCGDLCYYERAKRRDRERSQRIRAALVQQAIERSLKELLDADAIEQTGSRINPQTGASEPVYRVTGRFNPGGKAGE